MIFTVLGDAVGVTGFANQFGIGSPVPTPVQLAAVETARDPTTNDEEIPDSQ